MRIERVALTGFKSFFEKTVFNFHSGITAIVGPNGCGKSNIVDAFRWVLGEQSAKSLRGDRMEDVIFSGSAAKKPKGMAEITLTMSGVNNGSSSESGELSVTRRLYRSGESEYLMNKIPCRLKDIRNIFLDTGLELKTYSILEQGKIDGILNSKPQERRFLIEEVAGVMKYNVRKAEALSKLESSRSNLQRLQDIITEVKRQINSIERYAKKAERYKRLFDEIKDIEIKVAVRDVALFKEELVSLAGSEIRLKDSEAELSTSLHSSDALIQEKKLLCVEKEKELENVQNKVNSAEKGFIEEEGGISLLKSDCENLKGRRQRLLVRDNEIKDTIEDIHARIKNIEHVSTEIDLELSTLEKTLDSKNEELSGLEGGIKDLEQDLELKRKSIFNKADEISSLKNEINSLSLIIENLDKKEKKNAEDIEALKSAISSISGSLKEADTKFNNLGAGLKDKLKMKESLLEDMNRQKKELTAGEEVLYRDREELAAMISRADSLKELNAGGKKAVKDNVKILCQVADIFDTLPEHETAIEAVLGEKLNVAVVDDRSAIEKALKLIKDENISRSGFIQANASPAMDSASYTTLSSDSIVAKAIDVVKVREGFSRIAELLLSDVVIVKNLNTAFDLWLKPGSAVSNGSYPRYFVTLDGEVLESSGIVFGGIEKGVLKIKREVRELEKNIESRNAAIISAENSVVSLKDGISDVERNLLSLDEEISLMEKSFHELEIQINGKREEEAALRKRLEFISAELMQEQKEKESTGRTLKEKTDLSKTFDEEKLSIEKEMVEIQENIGNKKSLFETLRSALTETMLSRTAIKEKIDSYLREGDRLRSELSGIEKKKEEMSAEHNDILTSAREKEEEIVKKEEVLKSSVVLIDELRKKSLEIKEILDAKTSELNLIEKQQKSYANELSSIRKELSGVEVKKTELSLKLGHIKEDIKKTYSIEIDTLTGEQSHAVQLLPEEEEKLLGLREKLQGIGPVNLGTLEELEELKTRYDFLTNQQSDLLQSVESLQETILKINRTTQKKLTEAFEALNVKFKEVFTILFGKGRAELILTEESILDAGIDVIAQPPGKKLQNLMLLSGGEKALTALSLLFAGFMIKPTPLCLLDEVDAPLDESNTDRFTSLLKGLSKNIQFIAITHNRRTMEVADYIYGVTMEEPGISKIVSMHLAEIV